MNLKIFKNKKKFIQEILESLKDTFEKWDRENTNNSQIENQGFSDKSFFIVALSGGSTPKPVYKALANLDLPWQQIKIFQVDERYVPKNHPDSNYKLINQNLISKIENSEKKNKFPKKNFHFFDTNLEILESLKKYQKEIKNIKFNLTFLGIGTDGHIASLFPKNNQNTKNLNFDEKTTNPKIPSVLHTETNNFKIKDRLTLNYSKILESEEIFILLNGKEKLKILESNKNLKNTNNSEILPFQKILENHKPKIFLLLEN